MSTTLTIRLESDLKDRLDDLANVTNRSKSFLAAEAIQEFVALNEWQLQEIKTALAEADAGDFASEKELSKTLGKWGVDAD
jgi:RHH-type rel operon transcriptional repressor/antitoxin RelB